MRSLLRILAHLYPAAWRKRYGAEFEALIEDARPGLGGAVDILKGALTMQFFSWTPFRILAVTTLAGILIASGIAFAAPKKWSSTAIIQIASPEANPADRVHTIANTVMSRSRLTEIIRKNDIYRDNLKNLPVEDVLEIFKQNIQVTAGYRNNEPSFFAVRFTYGDPRMAQQVTQTLASNFVEVEPDALRLIDRASLPDKPTIPAFSAKFASVGAAGGLLIGAPIAGFLYWRRRKQP